MPVQPLLDYFAVCMADPAAKEEVRPLFPAPSQEEDQELEQIAIRLFEMDGELQFCG